METWMLISLKTEIIYFAYKTRQAKIVNAKTLNSRKKVKTIDLQVPN